MFMSGGFVYQRIMFAGYHNFQRVKKREREEEEEEEEEEDQLCGCTEEILSGGRKGRRKETR